MKTFPRRSVVSALTGAHPKIAVTRSSDGNYSVPTVSDEEHAARFDSAHDLARQFKDYCLRKQRDSPSWTQAQCYEHACCGLDAKAFAWDLLPDERAWIKQRLRTLLEAEGWAGLPSI